MSDHTENSSNIQTDDDGWANAKSPWERKVPQPISSCHPNILVLSSCHPCFHVAGFQHKASCADILLYQYVDCSFNYFTLFCLQNVTVTQRECWLRSPGVDLYQLGNCVSASLVLVAAFVTLVGHSTTTSNRITTKAVKVSCSNRQYWKQIMFDSITQKVLYFLV